MTTKKKYQLSLEDMDFNELVNYWTVRIIVAIGEGEFRAAVSLAIQTSMTMGAESVKGA